MQYSNPFTINGITFTYEDYDEVPDHDFLQVHFNNCTVLASNDESKYSVGMMIYQ